MWLCRNSRVQNEGDVSNIPKQIEYFISVFTKDP